MLFALSRIESNVSCQFTSDELKTDSPQENAAMRCLQLYDKSCLVFIWICAGSGIEKKKSLIPDQPIHQCYETSRELQHDCIALWTTIPRILCLVYTDSFHWYRYNICKRIISFFNSVKDIAVTHTSCTMAAKSNSLSWVYLWVYLYCLAKFTNLPQMITYECLKGIPATIYQSASTCRKMTELHSYNCFTGSWVHLGVL